MNKEEAQKRIENAERELAEAKLALLQNERAKVKRGEVWTHLGCTYIVGTWNSGESSIAVRTSGQIWNYPGPSSDLGEDFKNFTRLGTFDEVFIRRDSLGDEYISRDEVKEVINRALSFKDGYGDTMESPDGLVAFESHKIAAILRELL